VRENTGGGGRERERRRGTVLCAGQGTNWRKKNEGSAEGRKEGRRKSQREERSEEDETCSRRKAGWDEGTRR
jgi:hypothetical protein